MDLNAPFNLGTVLLDTVRPDGENGQSLLFTRPVRVLEAWTLAQVPPLLDEIDQAIKGGAYIAGYLGYEAGYAFEQIGPLRPSAQPLAWFGAYNAPDVLGEEEIEALLAPYEARSCSLEDVRFSLEREAYREQIAAIKAHIHAGDVYQINFTGAVRFRYRGEALALYRALRGRQRVAYGAFIRTEAADVLSCSPELFFRRDGRRLLARPMKGTVRRGETSEEDERLRRWLTQDEKSRAENLMIVDLLRNDLSVVCEPASVRVPALFTTEPYETLHQMTSTIEGRLREEVGYAALLRALFPCGSVTGAPKIRAMQLIDRLEAGSRGIYCGGIGFVAPDEQAVFSVAIRTVVLKDGCGEMGTGSGIVWDSDADAEYDECLLKSRFLTDVAEPDTSFKLIETMRWDGTDGREGIRLFEGHLDRVRTSARHFGFAFDEPELRHRVRDLLRNLETDVPHRVRVTLEEGGLFNLTASPLPGDNRRLWKVIISDVHAHSGDVFFQHKTTRRVAYEKAYQQAQEAGCDEALLLNERGEITEGSRTNLFIRRGATLYTPPVASGLLGGVYRRHLLETRPDVRERVLYPDDLRTADALYLCNAVSGLVEAELVEASVEKV